MSVAGRLLIVNADDFGMSAGVNRGVARAHENGIVTSASLMVGGCASHEAAHYARDHPELSVGLHVDLGEWVFADGQWQEVRRVVSTDDALAVRREVRSQVDMFLGLIGRPPTHIDSHQHAHRDEPARQVLSELAAELRVPLRHFTSAVHHRGDFYGRTETGQPWPSGISEATLVRLLRELPSGITELACHPGEPESLDDPYRDERSRELAVLTSTGVHEALELERIELVSFADIVSGATSFAV